MLLALHQVDGKWQVQYRVCTHPKHIMKNCGCWQDHPLFKENIDDFGKALYDWEKTECIPEMQTANELLKLRGGVAEKLYFRLIETALSTKKLPDFVEEAADDDDVFVSKKRKIIRGITSPTRNMMNDKGINLSTQPSKSFSRSPDSEGSQEEFDIRLSQLKDPNSYVYKQ